MYHYREAVDAAAVDCIKPYYLTFGKEASWKYSDNPIITIRMILCSTYRDNCTFLANKKIKLVPKLYYKQLY